VLLPCGQSLVVFAACAVAGSATVALLNGCAFALLTTPSLLFAMAARQWLMRLKQHYHLLIGVCTFGIGVLAICRGLADLEIIPHLVLNRGALPKYHIVIY
jgi:sulfite exporter TauE/SafE